MGGLAALAREAGQVTGCDANVYPPMSDQLKALGIELIEGYSPDQLRLKPDCFVIGNVITRGNPLIEAILDANLDYVSGPAMAGRSRLAASSCARGRWHARLETTTTSMLAWILTHARARSGLSDRWRGSGFWRFGAARPG